jgi:hypothetical protein
MLIKSHKELEVYKLAFKAALEIHTISKTFPTEEKYSLTEQIRLIEKIEFIFRMKFVYL